MEGLLSTEPTPSSLSCTIEAISIYFVQKKNDSIFTHKLLFFMCHVSHVTCHMSKRNWWSLLVEGLLSAGPTPSSLIKLQPLILIRDLKKENH